MSYIKRGPCEKCGEDFYWSVGPRRAGISGRGKIGLLLNGGGVHLGACVRIALLHLMSGAGAWHQKVKPQGAIMIDNMVTWLANLLQREQLLEWGAIVPFL